MIFSFTEYVWLLSHGLYHEDVYLEAEIEEACLAVPEGL